ncbi:MAG: cobalt ECF transporter T component CbiQ [Candidatus Nanopelagicaceae bacterium]|nr:cobalt ECF transporter T component CbiQ [Candidatus Nanopelagicaceae bacterium]
MHSLAPHAKILAILGLLVIVVATPIQNYIAFIAYFSLVIALVLIAKLPIWQSLKRTTIEIPFIFFAILMPFVSPDKEAAKIAAISIIAKATIGTLLAIILSGTTPAREILRGFETLKMPALIVQIASFMLRYLNVINDEMERMTVARASRGFEPKGIRDWKFLAAAAGALFIRSYERGERVHLSMISRGYDGKLPSVQSQLVAKQEILFIIATLFLALVLAIFGRNFL